MNPLTTKTQSFFLFIPLLISFACKSDKEVNINYPEGGYPYAKSVIKEDSTFWCYPLKDILSTKDSFQTIYYNDLLNLFDEQNLSLRPRDTTTFRIIYSGVMGPSAIVSLTPTQIVGKIQTKGWAYPYQDTGKLSSKEKFDFDILQRFFPLDDTGRKIRTKIYLDSLANVNPMLLDPGYYKYLLDKSADWGKEKFAYSIKKTPISKKTFLYLVNKLNESRYWELPFENTCHNIPNDVTGFTLEANTPKKYNIVTSLSCPDDTTMYVKACHELITHADIGKEFALIWDGSVSEEEPLKIKEFILTEPKEEKKPKTKKKKVK